MKISTILKSTAALALSVCLLTSGITAAETDSATLFEQMEKAKSTALSHMDNQNYTYAYSYLNEYASAAEALANDGLLHPYLADTAVALRDSYIYEQQIMVDCDGSKVFMGSDGYFAEGADAVRLSVPYGFADVEDYYHMIPKTSRELCVLVALEVETEGAMMNISRGKDDARLIENLRQISRIEGRVYLAFCPSVDTMTRTRTLHLNYIDAYRYVAEAARRYAPNVSMVYSLSDLPVPGEDTVLKFYPGDSYVDVLGVELATVYKMDPFADVAELNWYRRGDFYNPIYSVKYMADSFAEATGRDIPLMVTSCAFPWDGKYADTDWAEHMTKFFETLPRICPDLTAIIYSNESSSYGVCNLRQNPDAAAVYEQCIRGDRSRAMPLGELEYIDTDKPVGISVQIGGVFCGASYEVYLDGQAVDKPVFSVGKNKLTVYVTEDSFYSKAEYEVTVASNGAVSFDSVTFETDYNGNGILDHGDVELLTAYIARWKVDLGGRPTDINGDGKTNIWDISALQMMIISKPGENT